MRSLFAEILGQLGTETAFEYLLEQKPLKKGREIIHLLSVSQILTPHKISKKLSLNRQRKVPILHPFDRHFRANGCVHAIARTKEMRATLFPKNIQLHKCEIYNPFLPYPNQTHICNLKSTNRDR